MDDESENNIVVAATCLILSCTSQAAINKIQKFIKTSAANGIRHLHAGKINYDAHIHVRQ